MTCVSKEYEKLNKIGTGAMNTATGFGMRTPLSGGVGFPPVGKTLYVYIVHIKHIIIYIYIKEICQQIFIYNEEAPCTSHKSCAKVAILLLQDLRTLCVTDIYGICFHLSVQCT